ncbi:MAG: AEC family transporter [Desulforhopalus sp.]|nr:AEC family transporter [Desulforhopalus sp.]
MNSEIFLIVLPVFLVIGLGFSLKKTGLVNSEFLFNLNRLIYYIALPALLFYKIATANFFVSFNGPLLACLIVSVLIIFFISYGYGSFREYRPSVHGAFCQGAFRGNLAYVGLAIVYSAYGEEGFAVAGILLGFLVPLFNFLSVVALILPQRRDSYHMDTFFLVKQIVYNPLIVASFGGVLWSFLTLPLPLIVDRAFEIVTGMSLPLALIAIGASFSFRKLRGDLALAALSACLKIVILPALTGGILILIGVRGQELGIGVLLAGSPTATAAYIMAQQLKSDAELSGAIIMLSTLCSLATYTFALYLLQVLGI